MGGPFLNLYPPQTTKFSSDPPNSPFHTYPNPTNLALSKSRPNPFLSKFDPISILDLPFPTIPDPPDPEILTFLQQDINRNPHPGHTKPVQGCIFCPTIDHA